MKWPSRHCIMGSPYTWSSNRTLLDAILEILDRVIAIQHWLNFCKDARVENLPILASDHSPILLAIDSWNLAGNRSPFKFEAKWLL